MTPHTSASRRRGSAARARLSVFASIVLLALSAAQVAAHAELTVADPADGSTVVGSPESIALTFSEEMTDRSFFNLKGPDGGLIGKGALDPTDDTVLLLDPPTLAPGSYTLEWQSVAADGHIEKGKTSFTVVAATPAPTATPAPSVASATPPATASPSTPPTAAPSPTPTATSVDGSPAASTSDVVLPILAGLLLLGALAVFLLRRGRRA